MTIKNDGGSSDREFAGFKTKECITTELVFDMAKMQLTAIEDNFRNEWKKRYGSVTNCPIKRLILLFLFLPLLKNNKQDSTLLRLVIVELYKTFTKPQRMH